MAFLFTQKIFYPVPTMFQDCWMQPFTADPGVLTLYILN